MDYSTFVETIDGKDTTFRNEIIQLKTSKVPKGLVVLEILFDNQDRVHPDAKDKKPEELEEKNLGINEAPKKVYISKKLSPTIRKSLIKLLRKYKHVFAWSYDDLKA